MDRIIENLYVSRELTAILFNRVCEKYKMTLTEILILLFLSKKTGQDTARDIVDRLKLAKSHISVSVRDLEERGYLNGACTDADHRTIHLWVTEKALTVAEEARGVQKELMSVIFDGLTQTDRDAIARYVAVMNQNMNEYMNRTKEATR